MRPIKSNAALRSGHGDRLDFSHALAYNVATESRHLSRLVTNSDRVRRGCLYGTQARDHVVHIDVAVTIYLILSEACAGESW